MRGQGCGDSRRFRVALGHHELLLAELKNELNNTFKTLRMRGQDWRFGNYFTRTAPGALWLKLRFHDRMANDGNQLIRSYHA